MVRSSPSYRKPETLEGNSEETDRKREREKVEATRGSLLGGLCVCVSVCVPDLVIM